MLVKNKCTCHVYGQTHTGNKEGGRAMHKTKKEKRGQEGRAAPKKKGGEYKCTCHVCGQTHKYKGAKILARSCEEWVKWGYKCTCHVCGQTHKYRESNILDPSRKVRKMQIREEILEVLRWARDSYLCSVAEKVQVHLSRLWTDTQVH